MKVLEVNYLAIGSRMTSPRTTEIQTVSYLSYNSEIDDEV